MSSKPERTPVPLVLPLGLCRMLVGLLADFADSANEARQDERLPVEERNDAADAVRMCAFANDIIRAAGEQVEEGFNRGAILEWNDTAPEACQFLAGQDLSEAARTAAMDELDRLAEQAFEWGEHAFIEPPAPERRH